MKFKSLPFQTDQAYQIRNEVCARLERHNGNTTKAEQIQILKTLIIDFREALEQLEKNS